jgi:hypothetical protein
MMANRSLFKVILLISACAAGIPARGQEKVTSTPIEQGKFILHKFKQPIGEETYAVEKDGGGLSVKVKFKFIDRGTEVPLEAEFRGSAELTPKSFSLKGKNARSVDIDEAVEVQADKVRVRDREKWTESARPKQFFSIAGYAPATMQMLLFRYWSAPERRRSCRRFRPGRYTSSGVARTRC